MKNHSALNTALILLIFALSFFAIFEAKDSAAAQRVILCTNYPQGHPLSRGLHEFARTVAEMSNGEYEVRVIDNGKFDSVSSGMQALQSGAIHLMVESTGSCEPFFPALSIFDLPYLIPEYGPDLAERLLGPTVTGFLHSLDTKRVAILSVMGCAVRYLFTKKEVHALEDVASLKIRTTPSRLHMDIMQALGMTPTPLAWTELYTALQQGVVEGCDPELSSGPAMSFREVAPFWGKFDTSANVGLMFTYAPWWNKLPASSREMFMTAIHKAAASIIMAQQKSDMSIIENEKVQGREVFIPTPEEKARWIAATANVYKKHPQISAEMLAKLRQAFAK